MGDAINESGHFGLLAEGRHCPPHRNEQLLQEVVAISALGKAMRHMMKHGGMLPQPFVKYRVLFVVRHVDLPRLEAGPARTLHAILAILQQRVDTPIDDRESRDRVIAFCANRKQLRCFRV